MIKKISYAVVAAVCVPAMFTFAADGKAIDLVVVDNLGATVKSLLSGNGALIIDGIILAGSAYGTAQTRSPAPLVFGVISCAIFHLSVKALLGS